MIRLRISAKGDGTYLVRGRNESVEASVADQDGWLAAGAALAGMVAHDETDIRLTIADAASAEVDWESLLALRVDAPVRVEREYGVPFRKPARVAARVVKLTGESFKLDSPLTPAAVLVADVAVCRQALPYGPDAPAPVERVIQESATTLLVLRYADASEQAYALRLAHALATRGGPAVIVGNKERMSVEARSSVDREFVRVLESKLSGPATARIVGGGRLRDLSDLVPPQPMFAPTEPGERAYAQPGGWVTTESFAAFDVLRYVRTGIANWLNRRAVSDSASVRADRYSMSQFRGADDGAAILAHGSALVLGARYVLELSVTDQRFDGSRVRDRSQRLIEERFPDRRQDGRWIEFGITPLDFDVEGSLVQQVWLPASGPSAPVQFVVRPVVDGIATIRYAIYADERLIQSHRVAAIVAAKARGLQRDEDAKLLAEALETGTRGIRSGSLRGLTWAQQLEFGDGLGLEVSAGQTTARALSIFANDSNGRTVVTVKSAAGYGVRVANDAAGAARAARSALEGIATELYGGAGGDGGDPNDGTADFYERAMPALADAGWRLFDALMPTDGRDQLLAPLQRDRAPVQVAHLLLDRVVPWSLLYDRFYDGEIRTNARGEPVMHAVCDAWRSSLPDGEVACGSRPECMLNAGNVTATHVVPESVACPRNVWGFRLQVEVPPLQGGDTRPPYTPEERHGARKLIAGINAGLDMAQSHGEQLEALNDRADLGVSVAPVEHDRDRVLRALAEDDLDIAYLYCHAEGGVGTDRADDPALLMEGDDAKEYAIEPAHLQGTAWKHRPLVFLNGCRTAAFSPDALSPFITKLVEDRHAGGVLGTEVPVWEALACRMGIDIVEGMLGGASAGRSLLDARRRLLTARNPLGLAYTLYADGELAVEPLAAAMPPRDGVARVPARVDA